MNTIALINEEFYAETLKFNISYFGKTIITNKKSIAIDTIKLFLEQEMDFQLIIENKYKIKFKKIVNPEKVFVLCKNKIKKHPINMIVDNRVELFWIVNNEKRAIEIDAINKIYRKNPNLLRNTLLCIIGEENFDLYEHKCEYEEYYYILFFIGTVEKLEKEEEEEEY